MTPLRIAMFGHKRIPSREGGIEVVVEELSVRMAALGHQVTCYNRSGHHVSGREFDSEKRKEYQGVQIRNVFTIDCKGLAAVTASLSASLLAAFGKYDVVHIHAEGPAVMCWLPKLFGKRVIVTVHGLDHRRSKWGKFASKYILLGERNAVKYADEIIVLNHQNQRYFQKTYGRSTIWIPNGVNKPKIRQAEQITQRFGLKKDDYILFVGRLVPEKGLQYLIKAFREIQTDKKLCIVGGSSDSEAFAQKLKQFCRRDERIIFTGFLEGKILEELYSNAYIYVLPSDLEGMPLSLLEAMSYGNCCIISDIPECTEIAKNNAAFFRTSNIDDLKNKLQKLLIDQRKVDKHRKSSIEFIQKAYNWNDIVNRTLEIYRNVRSI